LFLTLNTLLTFKESLPVAEKYSLHDKKKKKTIAKSLFFPCIFGSIYVLIFLKEWQQLNLKIIMCHKNTVGV